LVTSSDTNRLPVVNGEAKTAIASRARSIVLAWAPALAVRASRWGGRCGGTGPPAGSVRSRVSPPRTDEAAPCPPCLSIRTGHRQSPQGRGTAHASR
jgi:hypothetical protein